MIKAVVFDLDDTLISENEYIKSGYTNIARILASKIEIGEDEIFLKLMELYYHSPKNVFNKLYEQYGIKYSREMISYLVNKYRGHYPNIKFYYDVLPCIDNLKKARLKTGIITDGYTITQRQKLRSIDAEKYFDEIIITDELGSDFWKPHPKAFELMREKLEVDFDEMIYIGDNPEKDFYIGKIYPLKTIRINREQSVYKNSHYYQGVKENFTIKSLYEIINIILKEEFNE